MSTNQSTQPKLYTHLEVQAAFRAWSTLSRTLYGSEDAWVAARRELWFVYTDARDNKPRGISRALEAAIPVVPKLKLL